MYTCFWVCKLQMHTCAGECATVSTYKKKKSATVSEIWFSMHSIQYLSLLCCRRICLIFLFSCITWHYHYFLGVDGPFVLSLSCSWRVVVLLEDTLQPSFKLFRTLFYIYGFLFWLCHFVSYAHIVRIVGGSTSRWISFLLLIPLFNRLDNMSFMYNLFSLLLTSG